MEDRVAQVVGAECGRDLVAAIARLGVQGLQQFKHVVDADLVRPFEGAVGVVGAEAHGIVHGLGVGGALAEHKGGLVDDHTHDAGADHADLVADLFALQAEGRDGGCTFRRVLGAEGGPFEQGAVEEKMPVIPVRGKMIFRSRFRKKSF